MYLPQYQWKARIGLRSIFYMYIYICIYIYIYIYVNNDLIKYIIVIVPVEPANARQARDPSPNDHPGSVR